MQEKRRVLYRPGSNRVRRSRFIYESQITKGIQDIRIKNKSNLHYCIHLAGAQPAA
jgi:hypothetical protein